jgi:hypothetical protein
MCKVVNCTEPSPSVRLPCLNLFAVDITAPERGIRDGILETSYDRLKIKTIILTS